MAISSIAAKFNFEIEGKHVIVINNLHYKQEKSYYSNSIT